MHPCQKCVTTPSCHDFMAFPKASTMLNHGSGVNNSKTQSLKFGCEASKMENEKWKRGGNPTTKIEQLKNTIFESHPQKWKNEISTPNFWSSKIHFNFSNLKSKLKKHGYAFWRLKENLKVINAIFCILKKNRGAIAQHLLVLARKIARADYSIEISVKYFAQQRSPRTRKRARNRPLEKAQKIWICFCEAYKDTKTYPLVL